MGSAASSVAGTVGAIGGELIGARSSRRAARSQRRAISNAIELQQEMFERSQELLAPFIDRGLEALNSQSSLLGLLGADSQMASFDAMREGPEFQNQLSLGEEAILSNASATGGLRGGNTQRALATFAPQLFNDQVQRRIANLSGLVNIGQNSALNSANIGQQSGNNIGSNLIDIGRVRAGARLATGQANANIFNGLSNLAGLSRFGGGLPTG